MSTFTNAPTPGGTETGSGLVSTPAAPTVSAPITTPVETTVPSALETLLGLDENTPAPPPPAAFQDADGNLIDADGNIITYDPELWASAPSATYSLTAAEEQIYNLYTDADGMLATINSLLAASGEEPLGETDDLIDLQRKLLKAGNKATSAAEKKYIQDLLDAVLARPTSLNSVVKSVADILKRVPAARNARNADQQAYDVTEIRDIYSTAIEAYEAGSAKWINIALQLETLIQQPQYAGLAQIQKDAIMRLVAAAKAAKGPASLTTDQVAANARNDMIETTVENINQTALSAIDEYVAGVTQARAMQAGLLTTQFNIGGGVLGNIQGAGAEQAAASEAAQAFGYDETIAKNIAGAETTFLGLAEDVQNQALANAGIKLSDDIAANKAEVLNWLADLETTIKAANLEAGAETDRIMAVLQATRNKAESENMDRKTALKIFGTILGALAIGAGAAISIASAGTLTPVGLALGTGGAALLNLGG